MLAVVLPLMGQVRPKDAFLSIYLDSTVDLYCSGKKYW